MKVTAVFSETGCKPSFAQNVDNAKKRWCYIQVSEPSSSRAEALLRGRTSQQLDGVKG